MVREEYYDRRGEQLKVFEVGEIEVADGYATATVRTMTTPRKDNSTVIEFSEIDYDTGVDERHLQRALSEEPAAQVHPVVRASCLRPLTAEPRARRGSTSSDDAPRQRTEKDRS